MLKTKPVTNPSLKKKNIVETVILEKQDFTREIISNGKLAPNLKAELYFKNPGIIEIIKVGNRENRSNKHRAGFISTYILFLGEF